MKVICVVQARMGSERLPGKVIKKLGGKPMVLFTLERLSKSRYIDKLVLATSDKKQDDPLAREVSEAGFDVFRGDEDNVLKRYAETVKKYMGDEQCAVVRVTGDCPFIDPVIVDNVITNFLYNDNDYVRLDVPDSFIRGFDVEVFSSKAMLEVYNKVKDVNTEEYAPYKEHVTLYMYRHPKEYHVGYVKGNEKFSKDYRLCVDTKEDFQLVENICKHFQDEYVSASNIVSYLDENPEVSAINSEINQKKA
ncbi:cytidylyltransferase domain-containing protein [Clostridium oryzae]|uniref:3-deoxy-manno-octulosonate cytidylyltransferase n=1 Tax=Clostridium oryzae TaxID=1450648 RepID=A0A1V4ILZ4_9CLOT|nr:glycosyltransferase family protein [Clostridium oryzae]OPJ60889.1 3-deoxy-manno-octulosonate cytidylyltransferase [Clostridium oryzae]